MLSTVPQLVFKKCGISVEVWRKKPKNLPPQ